MKRLWLIAVAAAVMTFAMPTGQAQAQSVVFTDVFCDLHRDVFSITFVVDAPTAGEYDFRLIVENDTRNDRYIGGGTFDLPADPVRQTEVDTFFSIGVETQFTDEVFFTIAVDDIGSATIYCDGTQTTEVYAPPAPPTPDRPTDGISVSGGTSADPPADTDAVSNSRGCTDNLAFVDDVTIPDGTFLSPGERFTKTWEIENTGTCQWLPDYALTNVSGSRLGFVGDEPFGITGDAGEVYTFSLPLIAPAEPGTYQSYWQMLNDEGQTFGGFVFVEIVVASSGGVTVSGNPDAISTDPVENPGGCTDNLTFVADETIPDGTSIAAGQGFTKTWRVENSGTCDWAADYTIVFVDGERMAGPNGAALSQRVAAGDEVSISADLVAPMDPGLYEGYWQLRNDSGQTFGNFFYTQIVVPISTASPQPPVSTDTGAGLYVKPYSGPETLNLTWAGQPPCGTFLTEGHGNKIAIASDFPTCAFPDVTVACQTNTGQWTRRTIFDTTFSPQEVRFRSEQHGLCAFFQR